MSKKIILILVALIVVFSLVSALNYFAYQYAENLDISVESSSKSLGALQSLNVSGDLGIFPESWQLVFKLSIWNRNPIDYWMEKADYIISLDETEFSKGQFQNVMLPKDTRTSLPNISITLTMSEIAETNPELISTALRNNGKITFKISVNVKTPALLLGILRIGTAETSDDFWESVRVVDSISVSSFNWHGENRYVTECHPCDEMTGEFRISKMGEIVESLEAKITEISSDGNEVVIAVQKLEGELTSYYKTFNMSWQVPSSLPVDCIGFSVHLQYGGVEVWSASVNPPSLKLVRRYTLNEALKQEHIDLVFRGTGYCAGDATKLKIKNSFKVSIDLEIEAGTVLINSGSGQNMIVAETTTLRIKPELELEFYIESYCLDLHKDNPSLSETFNIFLGTAEYSEDAVRLMQSLKDVPVEYKSISGVQIALWVIIENPSRSEVDRVFGVSESSLEDAAWLLSNIGIDPNQKRLFSEG